MTDDLGKTRGAGKAVGAVLLIPPVLFVLSCVLLRNHGGPFWVWHLVDPSYFYLFDAVNLINLNWPGHPYHPGTPVQVLGALVIRLAHPAASASEIAAMALGEPEGHLRLVSNAIIGLQAAALLAAGTVAWGVTRNLALALVVEAGPFLSMVILKNAYHVKPEPMLVVTVLVLTIVTLFALRDGIEARNRTRFAVAFGLIAGFGVATKLTAAPAFLFPIFLLGGLRAVLIYGLAAVGGFVLFTLPAVGAFHKFFTLTAMVVKSSGAYGAGTETFIDLSRYPGDVLDILKRPILHVPAILSLMALGIARFRRRAGLPVPEIEVRGLAGIALAILCHALVVGKQPTANYMVPSYMLAPVFIVLFYRFVSGLGWGGAVVRNRARVAVGGLLVVGLVVQGNSVFRQDRELKEKWAAARQLDEAAFEACGKIDFFPPSSPWFALTLADWWTGSQLTDLVAARIPGDRYWFLQNKMELWNARGPVDAAAVVKRYPCLRLRGGHPGPISAFMKPYRGENWDDTCQVGEERVFTMGTTCADKINRTGG